MPEVIDLISSSPEPELPPPRRDSSKETSGVPKPVPAPSKYSGFTAPRYLDDDDGWFQLSPDGSLPHAKALSKSSTSTTSQSINPKSMKSKSSIGTSANTTKAYMKITKSNISAVTKESQFTSIDTTKGGKDFMYGYKEDDFDSTLNLDDEDEPLASPPSSKKLRLSRSPKADVASKSKLGMSMNTTKLIQSTSTDAAKDSIIILDDDNSSSSPPKKLQLSPSPRTKVISEHKSSVNMDRTKHFQSTTTEAAKSVNQFYHESDFDSTINLVDDDDDPFASPPPPSRKRYLSSSPRQLPVHRPKSSGFGRSISNIESCSKTKTSRAPNVGALKRRKIVEEDPILFTSSPDPVADEARRRKEKRLRELDEERERLLREMDDEGGDDGTGKRKWKSGDTNRKRSANEFSHGLSDSEDEIMGEARSQKLKERSDSRLKKGKSNSFYDLDLDEFSPNKSLKTKSNKLSSFGFDELSDDSDLGSTILSDIDDLPSKASKSKPNTAKNSQTTDEKEEAKERAKQERERKKKERLSAKVAEKEQKELAKLEKAKEKSRAEAIAKVNTKRTDRKVSAPEMIVDLPSSLDATLVAQTIPFLKKLDIEHQEWDNRHPIVKWRRKVSSKWNEEEDIWEPCAPYIKPENHILYLMHAREFVDLVMGEEGDDLETHVSALKTEFDSCKIIYLIEGLIPWMAKNRNLKNRQFVEAVRSHLDNPPPATAGQKGRKKKEPAVYVDEEKIEDALLRLQVIHEALIHHVNVPVETAEWICVFTQHIATIPYKNQNSALNTTFCMESGQVKCGDNASDTYTKMLQEFRGITAGVAYGIAAKYPSVQELARGLEEEGPLALEDCRKCANANGAVTDRRVGPSISRRVHKVFLGRDEGSWEV